MPQSAQFLVENSKLKNKLFLRISKTAVYFLVFLLPLFFLPVTLDALEFQKQTLLIGLALISLVSFLGYVLVTYKLELNKSIINIGVGALLLASLLSTIFSTFRYGSFWGQPLPPAQSFVTLLALATLYFVIANIFSEKEIPFIFLTLFIAGFLVSLIFIFHLYGRFIIPFDFAKVSSFNTVGTVNDLGIYLSLLLILLIPLFFFVRGFFKFILGIFGLTFLLSLLLINFKNAWIVFLSGIAVLFTLGTVGLKKSRHSGFITFLMAFLIIGLIFTFSRFSLPGVPQIPSTVWPSPKSSFDVLRKVPVEAIILGTGPGTFYYNWAKHKPPVINQTNFWEVRFINSFSEFFDRIIGTGILGILALFFLLGICLKQLLWQLLGKIQQEKNHEQPEEVLHKFLLWAVCAGFVGLIVSFFLLPTTISTLFLLWLLISFSALLSESKKLSLDLQLSSLRTMGTSFVAILILILGIGVAILYGQHYVAEVKYWQGLIAFQKGDVDKSQSLLLEAANINPKVDIYWRDLAQIFLFKLQGLLKRTDLSQEELTSQAQSLIINAVNSTNQATRTDPKNVANWSIRGFVFRNLVGILGGAEEEALSSYERAKELEPASPYIFTEIGRIYLLKADLFNQQKKQQEKEKSLRLAQESFEKAIELKPDYAPAHFQIAMIYIRENRISEAVAKLEETKRVAPSDTGLAFQLGLVYYSNNQLAKAKAEFERAIVLDPNYSNARYFLGLILDKQGQKSEAISQFEKIQQLNPDNKEVKKILANLKEGKPALEGVVPGEPPLEEKPEEQLKEPLVNEKSEGKTEKPPVEKK